MLDGRFNPIAMRDGDKWVVIGFKRRNPKASFREIAYTLINGNIAYLSPFTVYRILKKHDFITPWKRATWVPPGRNVPEGLTNAGRRISCT